MKWFALGALLYSTVCYVSYSKWEISWLPYVIAAFIGIGTNLTWMHVSQTTPKASELIIKGMYWDGMVKFVYLAIPLLFFNAQVSNYGKLGIFFILLGGWCLKH